eukprot:15484628-Alexandrium_andersonii.AAC.1
MTRERSRASGRRRSSAWCGRSCPSGSQAPALAPMDIVHSTAQKICECGAATIGFAFTLRRNGP